MGIQSFKFPVDFLNNLEKPIIYVAKKDKTIVSSVAIYDELVLTCNLNAFQTATFKIYRDIDGKKQDYFKYFEEGMLIMIPGISWYEIHVKTNIKSTGISKSITANSLECKLCDKRLVNFQVNSDDFEDDDYVITTFYNPTDPKKSLLNRALNVAPNWSIGHVDASLADKQRTFDEDDVNVYSFLTENVSEAFNCLFVFDTFNCTVNAYDLDNYGQDTNIFVSMDNLAQNMSQTIDERSIYTCYRVNGGDGVEIAEVNPNGTSKMYNFDYYLSQMPEVLQNKVNAYNEKFQSVKPQYEDIVARMQTLLEKIQELYTRMPESLVTTDWTKYGLEYLKSQEKSFETQNEIFCAYGYNLPSDIHYDLYNKNCQNLNDVKAEIAVRESEIENAENEYRATYSELASIQEQLDMDNWFTEDEWKILDNYVIEETYTNDNFSIADNTSESELFSVEKELYEAAWKDLSKKCRPQYQYSATLSNILTIPEFKNFIQYFELGNFIRMETDYDTVIKLRIISFTVDYGNTQTIDVTFSDAIRVKDVYEDAASILAQANSAAMSFKFNRDQYDNSVRQGNFVAEMRKYGLDVATTQIYNATDQSQTWDSTGMTFRKWNDERQDYDPEMIKIINNMMVFLDGDNGARMAIGKISLPNGNSYYGINCELLANKLTMSENLWIENNSGTYKFDDSGFNASNGTNTIKIQPNNSGELISIYKGNAKQVYINSDGDVEFAGIIKSAGGIFSGLISGGEINLGNGNFIVDKQGSMFATNCNISGNISGSTITGTSISGGTITGGTLYGNEIVGAKISGSVFETTGNDSGFGGTIKIKDGTICGYGNDGSLQNIISPLRIEFGNLLQAYGTRLGDYVSLCGGALKISSSQITTKRDLYIGENGSRLIINGQDYEVGYQMAEDAYNKAIDAMDVAKNHTHKSFSNNVTFDSQTTLNGSISAPGVKNRTSTAVANVRCQDGTNSWLAIASSSSKRYKHDISDITDSRLSPNRLYDLPVRQYKYNLDYIDAGDQRYNVDVCGFIAEEMNKVYPIACEYNENGEPENWNERYIIPPMLALIQEQQIKIQELENRINILEQA